MTWNINYHGNVTAILILYNYCANEIDIPELPVHLKIILIPPNVTNSQQAYDMRIIFTMEFGYNFFYLRKCLDIFDAPEHFKSYTKLQNCQKSV